MNFINRTNTTTSKHKACVCAICDCFIIGTEPICWLTEEQLKLKESILSVDFLESTTAKKLPADLRNQYKIEGNNELSNMLLSPRTHVENGSYMSCQMCHNHIAYRDSDRPPKFAISNGWCIGQVPNDIIDGEISEILESSVARIKIYANVYSYNAGAHKAFKGHHIFLMILSM